LKDIEKFVRDHGGQIDLDTIDGELESKVETVIRELRNVLKEAIAEGGK
jgi:Ribonuclease G/E